jgi:hypothetical protein
LVLQVKLAVVAACMLAAATPAHAGEGDRFDAGTMAVQGLGGAGIGVLTGTVTGLAGGLIGYGLDRRNWGAPLAGAVAGFAIGASVGLVLGVEYMGDQQGGNGSKLGTTLGFFGGAFVLGLAGALVEKARWRPPGLVRALGAIVCFVGGPIVGYQLTNDRTSVDANPTFFLPPMRF